MSEYATKEDVQSIVTEAADKAVADLSEIIANFAGQVDERFNRVESDIAALKTSQNRLVNTIDGFVSRIDRYEN